MVARGSKNAQQRAQAERARIHAARTSWHDGQIRRRVRDNTIGIIVGVVIIAAAIASQVVHAQVAAPEPTPTIAPTDTPAPSEAPVPSETPAE